MPSPLQIKQAEAAAAPLLFSEESIQAQNEVETRGEFTGERLLQQRPEAYQGIVRMAAEGLSISATARAWGVSRNTVCAVREREGITIEHEKKELLRDLRRAARLSVERAIELVPHIQDAQKAAIVSAVMIDKMQLLSGEATSRIEKIEVDGDVLTRMMSAAPILEAEVTEITGPLGGESGQRGEVLGAGAAGEPVGIGGGDGAGSGCTDYVSDVSDGAAIESDDMSATLSATSEDPDLEAGPLAALQTGGEGVGFSTPPPYIPTGLGEEKISSKGTDCGAEDL